MNQENLALPEFAIVIAHVNAISTLTMLKKSMNIKVTASFMA